MKKIKVIDISGFKGITLVAYAIVCAVAGFIFFPAWAFMTLWNLLGTYVYKLPQMNLIHGFMLYAVVILLYMALTSGRTVFSKTELSNSHIAAFMKDFEDKK